MTACIGIGTHIAMIYHPILSGIIGDKLGVMTRTSYTIAAMQQHIEGTIKHALTILGDVGTEQILRTTINNLISAVVTLAA